MLRSDELSLSLLRHGYDALPRLWQGREEMDAARATLLGRPALVVRGPAGARLLYDDDVMRRRDAVPAPLSRLLFGAGAVHGLDGEDHRGRKELFLSALDEDALSRLGRLVDTRMRETTREWSQRTPFGLFDQLVVLYGGAALRWAGVEVSQPQAARLSRLLATVVDGFGFAPTALGPAWAARLRVDRWAQREVLRARHGLVSPAPGTMLHVLGRGTGRRLPLRTAGTELVNVVRPTTAVAWLGVHAAHALLRRPWLGPDLVDASAVQARYRFCQEVRRTAPFVPALVARVRERRDWHGWRMEEGHFVVLDVPGTNRHRGWGDPDVFRPERFLLSPAGAFDLVSQGGGSVPDGHRCPGEPVTMMLLDRTVRLLASASWTATTSESETGRVPTLPGRGMVISELALPSPA